MAVGEILQQKGSEKENCLLWCCFYEYIFAVASFFICIFIFLLLFLFHFLFRSIFAEIHMFCGGGNGIKKFFMLFSFPLGSLFSSLICHHIGIVILEYVFLLLYQNFADIHSNIVFCCDRRNRQKRIMENAKDHTEWSTIYAKPCRQRSWWWSVINCSN